MDSKEKAFLIQKRLFLIAMAKKDPWIWLTNFAYTEDSHDDKNTYKLFPAHKYLKITTWVWLRRKRLLVPKVRQIMMSWLFIGLYLWDTLYHNGRNTFFQSKKEDDANEMIRRAKVIYNRLPRELKPENKAFPVVDKYCELSFPLIGSRIKGIPQGAYQLNGQTISGLLSDEVTLQEEWYDAYHAAKPAIDGGGRVTAVGTPNGHEFFFHQVHDIENQYKDD